MKFAAAMLAFAVAGCSAKREPASDTMALDSATATGAATDSQSQSGSVAQPSVTTKTPARTGSSTKATSKTAVNADTAMHPVDTFGLHPRDSTIADFLKKRPPETRRPQDPQKTPRSSIDGATRL